MKRTLTPTQAYILEKQIERLKAAQHPASGDGAIMDVARAIAQDGSLVSLAHLTEAQADSLIEELGMIERRLEHAHV